MKTSMLVALVPFTAAAQSPDVSFETIQTWLAQHHANVAVDSGIFAVIIVADAKGVYVKGVAARIDRDEAAGADSGIAHGMRVRDDSVWTGCNAGFMETPAAAPFVARRPLCIADGKRVRGFDVLQLLAIRDFEIVTGPAASAKYGADAANGAVDATMNSAALERFRRLGVDAANVESMQYRRLRAGLLGPNQLNITVLFLKTGKESGG